jgi:transcription factor C subunit 3
MELIDKAGGVFPTGAALWYSFVSEWMKTRPKERPDMRTITTAVKVLVDAGQIRQLTFSGRDRKGVMVTRTMLMKPDISPEDPRVKDLQNKVLNTDAHEPRPTFSKNVVLNPELTRSGRRALGSPPKQQKFNFPVEPKTMVTLQQKPAFAKAAEARRGRALQRRLMRGLQAEADAFLLDEEAEREYGVQRLMTLSRPPVPDENSHPLTSVIRPDRKSTKKGSIRRLDTLINPKPRMRPMSNISQYALLMAPVQEFYPTSGTFSTGSGLAKSNKTKRGIKAEQFANKLAELAAQSQILEEPITGSQHAFYSAVDKVMKWEIDHQEVFNSDLEGMPYVNFAMQGEHETETVSGAIQFEIDMPRPQPPPVRTPMETRSTTTRRLQTDDTFQLKRKARRKPRPNRRLAALDEVATPEKDKFTPRPLIRRQTRTTIPEQMLRKIMIAITAVRVLTGGLDARIVEWNLVTRAFPDHDSAAMEHKARRTLNRNRLQIAKMQRDFQERFLDAYEKDQVPTIDYNDLENYDWPGVVEWASNHLDVPLSQSIPDLPATREQFDALFELRVEPLTISDEVYQSVHGSTINHKRTLMARTPFAVPVVEKEQSELTVRQKSLARLEDAKSWVRANIITSEESYKSSEAADILARIGEPYITDATQVLVNDRVITMTNSGRILPGRNYDISDNFLQTLSRKRAVDSSQLARASQFKTMILDPQLQNLGVFDVKYNAEDGDILALINLSTAGRIQLRPYGAPRDKFGLTDGGYLTRQMDKTRLRFPVKVIPTDTYVYGNPVFENPASVPPPPPPPASPYTDLGRRCPMWFDINGQLVSRLWKMAMGAVLGCMVLRPGVNARSISNMMKPTLASWEVVLMLQWLTEVGAVKGNGKDEDAAWLLQEWWWMVLS